MIYFYIIAPLVILLFTGIKIVRPTQRGLIERLGKYHNFASPGFHWIIPIIGTLTLKSANSEPGKINAKLYRTLLTETQSWGIEIVRTELKEIDPPKDVQETMNKGVKAENEKIAAIDSATAAETVADGAKRAKIKEAEGFKQSRILHAEGETEAIKLVNEAADNYFIGNAQLLRKPEALEVSLEKNAKIVIPAGSELINIIGEMAGILPLDKKV